jgi:hypothetical protein
MFIYPTWIAGVAQSVQCLTTDWTTGRSRFDPRQEQKIFPLTSVSRPDLRPTQPPVQWVPGVLSPGLKRDRGVTLTTHPHLVPRSRMSRKHLHRHDKHYKPGFPEGNNIKFVTLKWNTPTKCIRGSSTQLTLDTHGLDKTSLNTQDMSKHVFSACLLAWFWLVSLSSVRRWRRWDVSCCYGILRIRICRRLLKIKR